jgi:hypothetical protein
MRFHGAALQEIAYVVSTYVRFTNPQWSSGILEFFLGNIWKGGLVQPSLKAMRTVKHMGTISVFKMNIRVAVDGPLRPNVSLLSELSERSVLYVFIH